MYDLSKIIQDFHTANFTVNAMFHFLRVLPTNWTTSRSQRAGSAFCHKGPVGTPFPGGMFLESFGKWRVWETEKRDLKIWSPPLRQFGPTQPRPIPSPLNDRLLMVFLQAILFLVGDEFLSHRRRTPWGSFLVVEIWGL